MLLLLVILVLPFGYSQLIEADKKWLTKEKSLLTLLGGLNCIREETEIDELSKTFDPLEHLSDYKNGEKVENYFKNCQKSGNTYELFEILWDCYKDFDLFVKTASVARRFCNKNVFYSALVSVVANKNEGFKLSPVWEVFVQYFVSEKLLADINYDQMLLTNRNVTEFVDEEVNGSEEQNKLWYFLNDVGMANFYSVFNSKFPLWADLSGFLENNNYYNNRGVIFLWIHRELLLRYGIARISADLGEIDAFGFGDKSKHGRDLVAKGFKPIGVNSAFKHYQNNFEFVHDFSVDAETENSVFEALKSGKVSGESGGEEILMSFEVLGRLMRGEINPKKYGNLFSSALQIQGEVSGLLTQTETMVQDPIFYSILKWINGFYKIHRDKIPPHPKEWLRSEGIKIEELSVETNGENNVIYSRFEIFHRDVSNGVNFCPNKKSLGCNGRRLAHEDYELNLKVTSSKEGNVTIRLFYSPFFDFGGRRVENIEFPDFMVMLDAFDAFLTLGENKITYNGNKSRSIETTNEIMQRVSDAENGYAPYYYRNHDNNSCTFHPPKNLLLPKGTRLGIKFVLFGIINFNSVDKTESGYCFGEFGDGKGIGFPFDRKIEDFNYFFQDNMFVNTFTVKNFD